MFDTFGQIKARFDSGKKITTKYSYFQQGCWEERK